MPHARHYEENREVNHEVTTPNEENCQKQQKKAWSPQAKALRAFLLLHSRKMSFQVDTT
jgi:hypothetical protein